MTNSSTLVKAVSLKRLKFCQMSGQLLSCQDVSEVLKSERVGQRFPSKSTERLTGRTGQFLSLHLTPSRGALQRSVQGWMHCHLRWFQKFIWKLFSVWDILIIGIWTPNPKTKNQNSGFLAGHTKKRDIASSAFHNTSFFSKQLGKLWC